MILTISKEQQIKDRYADLAIKIDGVVKFLIEAKAAGVVLRDRYIEQAQRYAVEMNPDVFPVVENVHRVPIER